MEALVEASAKVGGTVAFSAVVVDDVVVVVVVGGFLLNSFKKVFLVALKNLPASLALLGLKNLLNPPVK